MRYGYHTSRKHHHRVTEPKQKQSVKTGTFFIFLSTQSRSYQAKILNQIEELEDDTDDDCKAEFKVKIDDDAETGEYNVKIRVSKDGYGTKRDNTSFDIIKKMTVMKMATMAEMGRQQLLQGPLPSLLQSLPDPNLESIFVTTMGVIFL